MSIVSSRISNFTSDRNAIAAMRRQQADIAQTQKEVSSGKRELTDPSQITTAESLKAFVVRADRYAENASLANYRLGLAEAGLASALDAMQTAREFVVNASTASVNPESRPILAIQVREMREHLLEIVNRKDAEGNALFAGLQTGVVPFVKSGSSIVYQGDTDVRRLQLSETRLVEDGFAGSELFVNLPQGNGTFVTAVDSANTGAGRIAPGSVTDAAAWNSHPLPREYTMAITEVAGVKKYEIRAGIPPGGPVLQTGDYVSGAGIVFRGASFTLTGAVNAGDKFQIKQAGTEDVFQTLNRLVAALDTPLDNPAVTAQVTSEYDSILEQVDRVIENLNLARASVGSRLDVVETTSNFRDEQKLLATKTLSTLQDVDFADAVSRLNAQMQALQVAQQVYAKASTKSLFDYL